MTSNIKKWPTYYLVERIQKPITMDISSPKFGKHEIQFEETFYLITGRVNKIQLQALQEDWWPLNPEAVLAIDSGYFLVANLVDREQVENLLDKLRKIKLAGQYYALQYANVKACEKALAS